MDNGVNTSWVSTLPGLFRSALVNPNTTQANETKQLLLQCATLADNFTLLNRVLVEKGPRGPLVDELAALDKCLANGDLIEGEPKAFMALCDIVIFPERVFGEGENTTTRPLLALVSYRGQDDWVAKFHMIGMDFVCVGPGVHDESDETSGAV